MVQFSNSDTRQFELSQKLLASVAGQQRVELCSQLHDLAVIILDGLQLQAKVGFAL